LIKQEESLQVEKFKMPSNSVTDSSKKSLNINHQFSNVSRDKSVQLVIVKQPESQHRARYHTEGSRGAVKDRSGSGFPIVKLNGYNKPTKLEVNLF
jgi:Rel homology DNA-binding domain